MREFYLEDGNFREQMEETALPELAKTRQSGFFTSEDGLKIAYRFTLNPDEAAAVVISHGFCEFAEKFDEVEYYFYKAGYSVFTIEHRGHGRSDRLLEDVEKVHVNSFNDYVKDMHRFLEQVVKKQSHTGKYFLFAHSMGGAIGALYLEKYPSDFEKAVLSSPMMQVNYGKIPVAAVKALALISKILHWEERYAAGQHGFDNQYKFKTSSCMSEERYAYSFKQRQEDEHCRTYGGTYGWSVAAMAATKAILKKKKLKDITTPVLLCQAGCDTMVKAKGQEKFAREVPSCRLVRFPQSKHEIFNATKEIRDQYYETVLDFLNE